jgi:pyridoxamine 5'-phosphate oxidase
MNKITDIRKEYMMQTLLEADLEENPLSQFDKWWQQAVDSHIDEVNAMTLATINRSGNPTARIVLLKGYSDEGFVFFTNYESEKAQNIEHHPFGSLVFFWKEIERQIRIEGPIKKISEKDSDIYFNSRPPLSKMGAWSSPQSKEINSRDELEMNFMKTTERFIGKEIPRPNFWGGYVVVPDKMEFWQGRPNRLHDRIVYSRNENNWQRKRLAP